MKCVICKSGETRRGEVSVTLEREGLTLEIKSVPAHVCENCGEQYLDEATTERLVSEAEEAVQAGVQVEIRAYRAA